MIVRAPIVALLASVLVILASTGPAAAHEADEGIVAVVDDNMVVITAAVAFDQLGFTDTSGDGLLDGDELSAQQAIVAPSLVERVRDHAGLTIDGDSVEIIGAGVPSLSADGTESETSAYVMLVLASGAHHGEVDDFELAWTFDGPSTKVVLSNAAGVVTGDLGDDGTINFSLSTWSSARSFFEFGIEHIQYGPDHLLFLLVLTLAAVGTTITAATTWRTVKLVTAFTVGHAISLGLAYFEVISIPAAIVEPAISLSIVAAAVLAIRRPGRRGPSMAGRARRGRPRAWFRLEPRQSRRRRFPAHRGPGGIQPRCRRRPDRGGADRDRRPWLSTQVLAERSSWVRIAGATGAAASGLVWTASRLVELPT